MERSIIRQIKVLIIACRPAEHYAFPPLFHASALSEAAGKLLWLCRFRSPEQDGFAVILIIDQVNPFHLLIIQVIIPGKQPVLCEHPRSNILVLYNGGPAAVACVEGIQPA